jgi:hypothetical protein
MKLKDVKIEDESLLSPLSKHALEERIKLAFEK